MDAEALITCARVNREDQPNALSEKRHNSVDSTEDAFESEPFPYTAVDGNLFTKDEDSSHFFFESKHHQLKENEEYVLQLYSSNSIFIFLMLLNFPISSDSYQKLMTALVKLEAQKIQAIKVCICMTEPISVGIVRSLYSLQCFKDLETLSRVKEEALANPLSFIQLLQEGVSYN